VDGILYLHIGQEAFAILILSMHIMQYVCLPLHLSVQGSTMILKQIAHSLSSEVIAGTFASSFGSSSRFFSSSYIYFSIF